MTDTPIPATAPAAATAAGKWLDVTIPLTRPITLGEKTIVDITLREPDLEGLEALDALDLKEDVPPTLQQSRAMIRILSGADDAVLLKLHKADFAELLKAMTPLLQGETA